MTRSILIILTFVLSTVPAKAALIDQGTYIADNVSGLNWLKLTATVGRSYTDVFSQIGSGGEFAGWTYASYSQASGLLGQFGFSVNSYTYGKPTAAQLDAIYLATSFLGNTMDLPTNYTGFGGVLSNPYGQWGHMLLHASHNAATNFYVINTAFEYAAQLDSQAGHQTGHFLIRAAVVPIPAALWMFSAALVGLIPLRSRRPGEVQVS